MAEALELRDHPDAALAAGLHEPPGPGPGHRLLREPQLGVRAELEGVVDLEDEDVHSSRREIGELALDHLEVGVVLEAEEVKGHPRGVGFATPVRGPRRQADEDGEPDPARTRTAMRTTAPSIGLYLIFTEAILLDRAGEHVLGLE